MIRLDVTALPEGLGAVAKVETEKHILVSLPSLLGIAWGKPVCRKHHLAYCYLFFPDSLLITVFILKC